MRLRRQRRSRQKRIFGCAAAWRSGPRRHLHCTQRQTKRQEQGAEYSVARNVRECACCRRWAFSSAWCSCVSNRSGQRNGQLAVTRKRIRTTHRPDSSTATSSELLKKSAGVRPILSPAQWRLSTRVLLLSSCPPATYCSVRMPLNQTQRELLRDMLTGSISCNRCKTAVA